MKQELEVKDLSVEVLLHEIDHDNSDKGFLVKRLLEKILDSEPFQAVAKQLYRQRKSELKESLIYEMTNRVAFKYSRFKFKPNETNNKWWDMYELTKDEEEILYLPELNEKVVGNILSDINVAFNIYHSRIRKLKLS